MSEIVRFKLFYETRSQLFKSNVGEIKQGTICIVPTKFGEDAGIITESNIKSEKENIPKNVKYIKRIANKKDFTNLKKNKQREEKAFDVCKKKIDEHKLPMKLIKTHYVHDSSRLMFFFTADHRIDFRNLVKDLAAIFKTRIELRQVGARDETQLLGGIGPCGRQLCCYLFKYDFESITVKMAKEQELTINTGKITGLCSKLLCCLTYEYDTYLKCKKEFPKIGSKIKIDPQKIDGVAFSDKKNIEVTITEINILKRTVHVKINDDTETEISLDIIKAN